MLHKIKNQIDIDFASKTPLSYVDTAKEFKSGALFHCLNEKLSKRSAKICVAGIGYVGLPLAAGLVKNSFPVIGFDVDQNKIDKIRKGESYIKYIKSEVIIEMNESNHFQATSDESAFKEADVIIICVPTPLTKNREPNMSYVIKTAQRISKHIRRGQLIILESTTYPGTTEELLKPMLEKSGLKSGEDFFLAYSPEREDPGNVAYSISSIPKVVGSDNHEALELASTLYNTIAKQVVPVSTSATAEAVKITENIFRSVNIALVNELKAVFKQMDIDIWEVIDAAKTKPFGFMPFYPGPGLGGHCIPIDPFYLTWKAHEYGISTRFIELAGEINRSMPRYVINRLVEALDEKYSKGLKNAKILISGVAYKKNVDDIRESPSLEIMDILKKRGAIVSYHDPNILEIPLMCERPCLSGMKSIKLSPQSLDEFDAVMICTDHDNVDYDALVVNSKLLIDTRNATKDIIHNRDKIIKA